MVWSKRAIVAAARRKESERQQGQSRHGRASMSASRAERYGLMETLYDIFGNKRIRPDGMKSPTPPPLPPPHIVRQMADGRQHDSPASSAPVVAVRTTSVCLRPLESNPPRFAFAPSHTSFDASHSSSRRGLCSSTFVSGTSIGCISRFKHGNGVQVRNILGHNWARRRDSG